MKKLMIVLMAFVSTAILFTSCAGEEEDQRMTDAEIEAAVDSLYDLEAAALVEKMTMECMEMMDAEVATEVDRLVVKAEDSPDDEPLDAERSGQDDLGDDMEDDLDMEDDADAEDERTDEEIIREHLDEKLAELRMELEEECNKQIMDQAKLKADSILIARDLEARYTTKGSGTGTSSGKTSTTDKDKDEEKKDDGKVDVGQKGDDDKIDVGQKDGDKGKIDVGQKDDK